MRVKVRKTLLAFASLNWCESHNRPGSGIDNSHFLLFPLSLNERGPNDILSLFSIKAVKYHPGSAGTPP